MSIKFLVCVGGASEGGARGPPGQNVSLLGNGNGVKTRPAEMHSLLSIRLFKQTNDSVINLNHQMKLWIIKILKISLPSFHWTEVINSIDEINRSREKKNKE